MNEYYAMMAHSSSSSSSRQHSSGQNEKEQEKLNGTTSVLKIVFLVPTAVGSYNDTHAHTRTLTNTHAEAPFVTVTKGEA